MSKIIKKLAKLLAFIWVIAFLIFILSQILKDQGFKVPNGVDKYIRNFDSGLEAFTTSLGFGIFFIIAWMSIYLKLTKDSGIRILAKKYSILRKQANKFNSLFKYGGGNLGGVYKTFFTAWVKDGIIIKEPFPFIYLVSPILIPWKDIEKIKIVYSNITKDKHGPIEKILLKLSLWKYAEIKLSTFKDQIIITPWKDGFMNSIPPNLNLEKF